jgi:predicted GIY-YIG superfamily endonuclease
MFYVYTPRSRTAPEQPYIGFTEDLKQRLSTHNAGGSSHTAKFRPWDLVSYQAFLSRERALAFEKYLKSGSGKAFAKKHLW